MGSLRIITLLFLLANSGSAWSQSSNESLTHQLVNELINTSQDHGKDRILELWGYHDSLGSGNYADTLKLRYYNPLDIGSWHGTVRLDTAYTANYGPQQQYQSTGAYSPNNAMLTIWGGQADWLANLGARLLAPLNNQGQWAIGPQIGTSFSPKSGGQTLLSDISPLARYMYGFDQKAPAGSALPTPIRRLELYPTVGLNLNSSTQIRFWDENGILYNSAGGGWFVPLDAMVTHRFTRNFLFAIGASKQLVQTYQGYNWSVYSKLSFNF